MTARTNWWKQNQRIEPEDESYDRVCAQISEVIT